MIIVRFTSGLGNQMFQYSFYRFLKDLYRDTPVKADLTWFYANNDHHGYELERIFGRVPGSGFSIEEAGKGEILKVTGLIPNIVKGGGTGSKAFEKFRRYPNRIIREFTQKKREPYMIDQLSGKINNEDSADGSNEMYEMIGQIFADQKVDPAKVEGDVEICAYLQGYGDTTTDEINAAVAKEPEAFLSVGMATTFFTQILNEAGIPFADIDSFTEANGAAIKDGQLVYLAGKYSSSIGPVFALIKNAVDGNVIRDEEGNAPSFSQGYLVATDGAAFDEYYVADNGDKPIYDKETLDTIIGEGVTYDDVKALVEAN